MQKIWNIIKNNTKSVEQFSESLNISPILAKILINRNLTDVKEARDFLFGDISSTFDPFLLKGMDKAVARIKEALNKREHIMVYGDYDVDGISSIALLKIIFRQLGRDVLTYIPNRLEEGYGLNKKAVEFARDKRISLIITADCGIGAIEEVDLANSFGIDVIVTDHHEIKKDKMPEAHSIINPHQAGCAYPFKHLAGVGIAYKLAQALMKKKYYPLEEHLDLVALGTVADIVPQKGENRVFTKLGVARLNETNKAGLKSLISAAGIGKRDISTSDIGYVLGPRINAMGRIGSPDIALNLLLTDNKVEADKLAGILNQENRNRQRIEKEILEEAISMVERDINFKEHRVIVLAKEGWHAGVIGIVSSRIQEKYYRPAILIAIEDDVGKGSARSIDNFNLFNALINSKEYLIDFGGHEAACGLSIYRKDIDKFNEEINKYAKENIKDADLLPKLDIDIDMPLSELNFDLINELELLKPYGPDNPRPVFLSSGIALRNEPKFIARNGFKIWVSSGSVTCEAISFRRELMEVPKAGQTVDIAYSPSINNWQGIDSIQLDLCDIKIRLP